MIVTELATNALKYAYPDGAKGEIRACFKRFDENRAVLSVADDGVGMGGASRNPTSTGLGQKIVKSMADAIGSGLSYPDIERGMTIEIMVDLEYTAPKN
jgi:two-component sensor histidine kinase